MLRCISFRITSAASHFQTTAFVHLGVARPTHLLLQWILFPVRPWSCSRSTSCWEMKVRAAAGTASSKTVTALADQIVCVPSVFKQGTYGTKGSGLSLRLLLHHHVLTLLCLRQPSKQSVFLTNTKSSTRGALAVFGTLSLRAVLAWGSVPVHATNAKKHVLCGRVTHGPLTVDAGLCHLSWQQRPRIQTDFLQVSQIGFSIMPGSTLTLKISSPASVLSHHGHVCTSFRE